MGDTTLETRRVIERHWNALLRGDVQALIADYAPDAVLITGVTGVSRGSEAIRGLLEAFVTGIIPPQSTRFALEQLQADGELALLQWNAESATHRIPGSADTFVVRGGRILAQTSAGQLIPKSG
jgi:ketosteroid isomerase-like protein